MNLRILVLSVVMLGIRVLLMAIVITKNEQLTLAGLEEVSTCSNKTTDLLAHHL